MRILLVALNARYVHTNLAVRYLREALKAQGQKDWNVGIKEFSINEQLDSIAGEIFEEKPDVIGFSCYIWNISQVTALVRHLRLVLPRSFIFVGGPEVSYDAEELLARFPQLDVAVIGEGEESVPALVRAWSSSRLPWDIGGIAWRLNNAEYSDSVSSGTIPTGFKGQVISVGKDLIIINQKIKDLPDLNNLPDPYSEEEDLQGRLAYVETTRGCPYNCRFCISSTFRGVRYLEPERFRLILRRLFNYGAGTVKFVDRTFNTNKRHAFQILSIFREEAEKYMSVSRKTSPDDKYTLRETPRAHCELAGELLDQEWLEFLKDYPEGMIQLEVGVQSTHQPTLEAINRPQNFRSWKDKADYLQHNCHIPIHLDLIAGLPFEGWKEFSLSFNEVYEIRPDNLQLGFLKVLKGSGIWEKSEELGLIYSPDPPYTVLKTAEMSHAEILALKRIEEILEKYYNSGRFRHTLEYVVTNWESSFEFYHSFAEYWHEQAWFRREWSKKDLFSNLWQFLKLNSDRVGNEEGWKEALRFDYYLTERPGQVPEFLQSVYGKQNYPNHNKIRAEIDAIRKDPLWHHIIPESREMDRRQWARSTAVEHFAFDIPARDRRFPDAISGNSLNIDEGVWYLFFYTGKKVRYFKVQDFIGIE